MPDALFKAMKRSVMLIMLSMALLTASVIDGIVPVDGKAYAQTVVRQIQVQGNRRVEPETVRSYLDFSVGDRYDDARVNSSLRALFATGLFADVNIYRQGTVVVITVVENPIISKVAFEGNSDVDTKTLQAEVRLKSRSVYTRARAVADAQRILDVYRRQGMFAASVRAENHRDRRQSRQPGVRDHRRCRDQSPEHQLYW